MKRKKYLMRIFLVIPFLMIGLIFSCKPDQNKQQAKTSKPSGPDGQVLASYFELKDALVASDVKKASQKANSMTRALKKAHDYGNVIIFAESIAGADNLADQRTEFEKISKIMYEMAKASKFGNDTVYRLYCPMAFDNKGAYWLSESKTIMNPYFGDKMLHCGRLEETIVADHQ